MARVVQRLEAMTGRLDAFQLRPEIEILLQRLVARGLILAATGAPRERLERAGIASLFAPDIAVPGCETIFVGDRLDRDIAPAKEAGMATIQFRTGRWRKQRPRSVAEMPDAIVTDVWELEEAILGLLGG